MILGSVSGGTPVAGNNTYSGLTTIAGGEIQIRHPNALGTTAGKTVVLAGGDLAASGGWSGAITEPIDLTGDGEASNGALQANDPGTAVTFAGNLTLVGDASVGGNSAAQDFGISGNISGTGGLTKLANNVVTLLGTNTYSGATTVSNGTLRIGNGLTNSALPGVLFVEAGKTANFRVATNTTVTQSGVISGGGQIFKDGFGGKLVLSASNDWTGILNINQGSVWITTNGALGLGPKEVLMVNGTAGQPELHLDAGASGSIVTPADITMHVSWVNGAIFNESGNNTILGQIKMDAGGGDSKVAVNGGTLTLAGDVIAVQANRGLHLGGAGAGTLAGTISDAFSPVRELAKDDSGTWTVVSTNTTTAALLTVNGGTLLMNGEWGDGSSAVVVNSGGTLGGTNLIDSPVYVKPGGTLAPGASIGTLTINNNLQIGGNLKFEVDRSQTQSNDVAYVAGSIYNTNSGTLTIANLGPTLQVGDKFYLFNQPVTGGSLLTVTGGGATWQNDLESDGSITVLEVGGGLPPNFQPGGITRLPDHNISLTATGAIGSTFKLWGSTNVAATPITNTWTLLTSGTVTFSPFTIVDLAATNYPRRFYLFSAP